MKNVLLGSLFALGIAATAQPGFAAQYGIGGVESSASSAMTVQWDDRRCRRLRRACENKAERGQEGEGNCRRYRRECRR